MDEDVRSVVLVCAQYIPSTRMAEPDAIAFARADRALHLVRIDQGVREHGWVREGCEGGLGALDAEAAMSTAEGGYSRGSDDAILCCD